MRWEDCLCRERENQGFRLTGALRARPFGDFLAFAADFGGWAFFMGAGFLGAFACLGEFEGAAFFRGGRSWLLCFASDAGF